LASAARNVAPAAPFPISILPSKYVYLAEQLTSSTDDYTPESLDRKQQQQRQQQQHHYRF
jgi:hypothetical protein